MPKSLCESHQSSEYSCSFVIATSGPRKGWPCTVVRYVLCCSSFGVEDDHDIPSCSWSWFGVSGGGWWGQSGYGTLSHRLHTCELGWFAGWLQLWPCTSRVSFLRHQFCCLRLHGLRYEWGCARLDGWQQGSLRSECLLRNLLERPWGCLWIACLWQAMTWPVIDPYTSVAISKSTFQHSRGHQA